MSSTEKVLKRKLFSKGDVGTESVTLLEITAEAIEMELSLVRPSST